MFRFMSAIVALAALAVAPIAAAQAAASPGGADTITIYIDNRGVGCDADSRIAEGNRRRASIKASRLAKEKRAQGYTVNIVTIEPTDQGFNLQTVDGNVPIRIGC